MCFKSRAFKNRAQKKLGCRGEPGGVRPGPVVRQSVMEKTGGNFRTCSFAMPGAYKVNLTSHCFQMCNTILGLKESRLISSSFVIHFTAEG